MNYDCKVVLRRVYGPEDIKLRLNEKFKVCHISIVIAIWLCCSQFITLLNKYKVQGSTFSTGNPLIQVTIVSLQVKLVTILLGWLSKVLMC